MDSLQDGAARVEVLAGLSRFRREFYGCLTLRADALFELADAVLCAGGPVVSLPELSLAGVHRRGHGAMYDALAQGHIDVSRLRMALAGLKLPRGADGQLSIALDVTPWPRPDAECSPERLHCHRPCRCDGVRQTIPGWPYQVAAALGGGRSSWTGPLDAVRLGPEDDPTEVTATQIRDLLARLERGRAVATGRPAGAVRPGLRLRHRAPDLAVARGAGAAAGTHPRRPGDARTRPASAAEPTPGARPATERSSVWPTRPPTRPRSRSRPAPTTASARSWPAAGAACTRSWTGAAPGPTTKANCPIVEGTLVHLAVEYLPGNRDPKPLWLWHSDPRRQRARRRPPLADLPQKIRHRTHFPVLQADPRPDPPPPAHPRTGRPVGVAHPRRLHPTPTRPPPGRGPPAPLGEAPDTGPAHPRPGPARLSPHPPDPGHSGQRAESHPPWPRPPQGPHLHPRTPPPSRQETAQNGHTSARRSRAAALKIKLRADPGKRTPPVSAPTALLIRNK